jgi:hypothetical protein
VATVETRYVEGEPHVKRGLRTVRVADGVVASWSPEQP